MKCINSDKIINNIDNLSNTQLGFPKNLLHRTRTASSTSLYRHHHHHHRHHHNQLGFPENLLQSTRTAAAFSIATLCKSTGLWRFCHFGEIWTWISQDLNWNLDLTRSGFWIWIWIWICRDMSFGQFTWAWSLESKSPSSFLVSVNLKENDKNAILHPESIHHLNNRLIQPTLKLISVKVSSNIHSSSGQMESKMLFSQGVAGGAKHKPADTNIIGWAKLRNSCEC